MFKKVCMAVALVGMSAFGMNAVAQSEQVLSPTVFMDQWEQPQALSSDTKWLIFTADKQSGKWVKETLETMDVKDMAAKNWLYVADVSGMPSFITKFMAIPKMKDYAFPIALEREGVASSEWPKQEDSVNIYELNNLVIQKVHTLTSAEDVSAFLKSM